MGMDPRKFDHDRAHKMRVDLGYTSEEFDAIKASFYDYASKSDKDAENFDEFHTWMVDSGNMDKKRLDKAYEENYAGNMSREEFDKLADEVTKRGIRDVALPQFLKGMEGSAEDVSAALDVARVSDDEGEFAARQEYEEAQGRWDTVEAPEFDDFVAQEYEQGDPLKLAQAQFGETGDSAWADPDSAMQGSLDYFESIRDGGGLDAVSRAEREGNLRESEQRSRAMREANQMSAEARGISGSGTELLGDLASSGAMTEGAYMHALGADAMGQQRRDHAGAAAYDMGGGIANASDAWGQWNTARDDANAVYNNGIANQEAGTNFNRANATSDANTQQANKVGMYNHQLPQQEFANDMSLTGAKAGMDVQAGNFGGQYDMFNDNMDWQEYVYEDSKPKPWEKALGAIGAIAQPLTSVAQGIDYMTGGKKDKK